MAGAMRGGRASAGAVCVLALTLLFAAAATLGWAQGRTHRVAMKDVAFVPPGVTVHVGDTVVWENADIVAHTASSEGGGFDVEVKPGERASVVLSRAGTFGYLCRYHPNMRGEIVVER